MSRVLLLLFASASSLAAEPADPVGAFLQAHCVRCHGPSKQEGKLALHAIDRDIARGRAIETWKRIAERLALNEMPPDGEPRPDARAASDVLTRIKADLLKGGESVGDAERKLLLPGHGNRVDHDALFSAKPTAPSASPPRLWRLSPQVYAGFIPRITGSKGGKGMSVAQPFSTSSAEGFKDYADLFVIDEPTIGQLLRNASQVVAIQTSPSPGGRPVKEFAPLVDPDRDATPEQVRAAVRRQFQLALQREPKADESARFVALYEKNVRDSGRVIGGRTTLSAVLLLPEAMYRMELGDGEPDAHGRRLLAPRELAHAIALALTDQGPDPALLKAAETGRLAGADDVRREVMRILDDPKIAKPRIERFFEEYFEFPAAMDVFKDLPRGQWRPEILVDDTRRLIRHILDLDQDVLRELLTTDKSFVNYRVDAKGVAGPGRIANKDGKFGKQGRQMEYSDLYNLPDDWKWTDKQPIRLPADQRAGILTQPAWLAAFATNDENHAIRRGKWVRERLLGGVVPDLPITVDAQLPHAPEKTLRQRMSVTDQTYCRQCHSKMNPLGLTFERYDYVGRFRTAESVLDPSAPSGKSKGKNAPAEPVFRQVAIDSSASVEHSGDPALDGPVVDAIALMRKLAGSTRVRQVFVRHAFRYWMGRNETLADAGVLQAADRAYVDSGGSMKALISSLIASDAFLYRYAR